MPQAGRDLTLTQMGKLSEFDPELLALFRGEAAAEVEAAVLAGTLANTPPPRISESEQKAALVEIGRAHV